MCGIVGYVGKRDSVPISWTRWRGWSRGYDSAGIAVIDSDGALDRVEGRGGSSPTSRRACSTVRRCTAHRRRPHALGDARPPVRTRTPTRTWIARDGFAVVHNGIIENYATLRAQLLAQGHVFKSRPTTRSSPLIETRYKGDLVRRWRETLALVPARFALGVISSDTPGRLIFARNGATR